MRLFLALLFVSALCAAGPEDELAKMSGAKLIERLQVKETQWEAFLELSRRGKDDPPVKECELIVIRCPQGKGKGSIFIVLHPLDVDLDPEGEIGLEEGDYEIKDPDELFEQPPPAPKKPREGGEKIEKRQPLKKLYDLVIVCFDSNGKLVTPFGGNNMIDNGVFADLTGDKTIERADFTSYGVKGVSTAKVFEIHEVREKEKPLLAVLYDWVLDDEDDDDWDEESDWGYDFVRKDGDDLVNIVLGPMVKGKVKPVATWRWNAKKKRFDGPDGKDGKQPFRRLDENRVWKEMQELKKKGMRFPKAVKKENDPPEKPAKPEIAGVLTTKHSKPYKYQSMKGKSFAELEKYMGRGRSVRELEAAKIARSRLPKDFWSLSPKKAAAAMIEANRKKDHVKDFQVAIDDRDGEALPETCTVHYAYSSDRSYVAVDSFYFLRVDPKESYLVYARSSTAGIVFHNILRSVPMHDLRFCKLDYKTARQIAHSIWWLDRVRTRRYIRSENMFGGMMHSSADGDGTLCLTDARGKQSISITETFWAGHLGERWQGRFNREALVNFAGYLMMDALPAKIGKDWTDQGTNASRTWGLVRGEGPSYKKEGPALLEKKVGGILERFSLDQKKISFLILGEAVAAAGDFPFPKQAETLSKIAAAIPKSKEPIRRDEWIRMEMQRIRNQENSAGKWLKLNNELQKIKHGAVATSAREMLRDKINFALKQIAAVKDVAKLEAWASSNDKGWGWALAQLSRIDKKRYVKSLEWRLEATHGRGKRQVFEAIAKADPKRARELAKELPTTAKGDLTVVAYTALEKAQAIPDEKKRVDALIEVALDPKSGYSERSSAIDHLVPRDRPLRYKSPKIDAALLRLFDPKLADDIINFTLSRACEALARRGRVEHFDAMAKRMETIEDGNVYHEVIQALAILARKGGPPLQKRFAAIARPHLYQTNRMISEIIQAIRDADCRELKPDLERIATASPADMEGRKASSYGSEASPVVERYHDARKVVAIWNEKDPVTRIGLRLARGRRDDIGRADIVTSVKEMSDEQKKVVRMYLTDYEKASAKYAGIREPDSLANTLREALGMPMLLPKNKQAPSAPE